MQESKIADFYDDPVKQACDELSTKQAFEFRSFCIDPALRWATLRYAKFLGHWARGFLRRVLAASENDDAVPQEEDEMQSSISVQSARLKRLM
jgi:hypothetical protein